MTEYPEHDKVSAVVEASHAQGELLEWLHQQGYRICELSQIDNWHPITASIDDLLARFHNIDRQKLEVEKRAILDEMRVNHRKMQSKP